MASFPDGGAPEGGKHRPIIFGLKESLVKVFLLGPWLGHIALQSWLCPTV